MPRYSHFQQFIENKVKVKVMTYFLNMLHRGWPWTCHFLFRINILSGCGEILVDGQKKQQQKNIKMPFRECNIPRAGKSEGQGHDLALGKVMTLTLTLLKLIFSCHRCHKYDKLPRYSHFWQFFENKVKVKVMTYFLNMLILSQGDSEYITFCL